MYRGTRVIGVGVIGLGLLGCGQDGLAPSPQSPTCLDYDTCRHVVATGPCPEAPMEVCDGVDNNCDGRTDEWDAFTGRACSALMGCIDFTDCGVYQTDGDCPLPPPELCDGRDNNCDGQVDEINDLTGASCDPVENTCINYQLCTTYQKPGVCPQAPDEICDGIDNDCDGEIDESPVGNMNVCQEPVPCTDWDTCTVYDSRDECPPPPPDLCDGVDNDCDGQVDEDRDPFDFDQDGIPNLTDPDDDNDGIPDASDEFPEGVVTWEAFVNFDTTAGGATLSNATVLSEQYSSWGIHFSSGYHVTRRTVAFWCYNGTSTLNVLCTPTGATGGNCSAPASNDLIINVDEPISYASIEMRTRCDGTYDGDWARMTAYDDGGSEVGSTHVTGNNAAPFPNEGTAVVSVLAPRTTRLRLEPGDFDTADNLRLVRLEGPCGPL